METQDKTPEVVRPDYQGSRILLLLEPAGKLLSFPRPKTARQLLEALNLLEESALIARDGQLLTPDRRIWPNDKIYVRIVASRG